MKTGITGITMGAGNVIVLKETLKSLSTICDEIIYGDMLLFEDDRRIVYSYTNEFNLKIFPLPFDYIFVNGFASVLNLLASEASNSTILYLNTSEIIQCDNGILDIVSPEYNCYYFDHFSDPHRWYRFYDKRELQWSGKIHESLEALPGCDFRPYHKPVFRMADMEKDMQSAFKAYIFNSCKEIVYFKNYMSIVDNPETMGATDPGWIKFATENYDSMKERLLTKGVMYQAFLDGNYDVLMKAIYDNPEFGREKFESNIGIEYQGDKKYLL